MSRNRPSPGLIVFALWLLVFAASSQIMIISPILPRIGEELGIAESVLGTLVSAYSLMVGIFAIISGPISDKIGRRRILLLGTGIMTGALLLHHFVVGYYSFLAVRVCAGLAGGILSGAAVAYVGDYFPYNRRGWATGWVMSGMAAGQIAGIPLGIVLAGALRVSGPLLPVRRRHGYDLSAHLVACAPTRREAHTRSGSALTQSHPRLQEAAQARRRSPPRRWPTS